jgi:hypothetical protein
VVTLWDRAQASGALGREGRPWGREAMILEGLGGGQGAGLRERRGCRSDTGD